MRIDQAIGRKLLNTTSITTIVGDRIFYGLRPEDETAFPCINFFELVSLNINDGVLTHVPVQVSCRATEAGQAQNLAYAVEYAFMNLSQSIQPATSSLDPVKITGCNTQRIGLIFEDECFHVPVQISINVINTT